MIVGGLSILGNVISAQSGVPATTISPIATSAYVSTNYSVSANQAINFDTVLYDTASGVIQSSGTIFVGSANTWKFVAPVSGVYRIHGIFNNSNNGANGAILYKNGVIYGKLGSHFGSIGGAPSAFTGSIRLNAGEYISVNSDVTGTVTGGTAPFPCMVNVELVR